VNGPLVSVLIPTFNRAGMVVQAIESALAQTYRHIEVIVADNASVDDTATAVRAIAARDPRVRYVRHDQNRNYLGNMRFLLEAATGEYVKFLMDDDVMLPDCVDALLTPCLTFPNVHFAVAKRRPVDEDLTPIPDFSSTAAISDRDGIIDGRALGDLLLRLNLNLVGEATSVLFHRSLLPADADVFAFDDHDFEANLDVSLWLKMLSRTDAFHVAEPMTLFRVHGQGKGSTAYLVPLIGNIEWERLIAVARRFGFLADPSSEIEALGTFIRNTAQIRPHYVDVDHRRMLDEAVARAGSRLSTLVRTTAPVEHSAEERMARVLRDVTRAEAQAGILPSVMTDDTVPLSQAFDHDHDQSGPTTTYDLSLVIPLHDRVATTERCLTALADSGDDGRFEVVLVDDRSTDATSALLACLDGDVTVVRNTANVGLAALFESGVSRAKAPLIALASQDLHVEPGWVDAAVDPFTDPAVGVVELWGDAVIIRREAMLAACGGAIAAGASVADARDAIAPVATRAQRAGWRVVTLDARTPAMSARVDHRPAGARA
jgi:glycosyltransferase involved in cell wall biosynthesis